jgi:nucleoside-diphosphate-sugar epimerase
MRSPLSRGRSSSFTGHWVGKEALRRESKKSALKAANSIRDLNGLTEAFRDVSVVLHHAGMSSVPRSFEELTYTHEINVTGTLNVLTAALRADVRKVINASSSSVYGNNGAELQTERAVPSPLSPYGLSKWMGELYATQFARSTHLETISLR